MGAPRKADWREERRKRAWDLKEQGWQQKDIAVAWGVSEGAVSQWLKQGREQGVEALTAPPPTGVTLRLTAEQKAQIPELLAKGAEVYRFRGDVWSARRVAEVIDRTFGMHYHRITSVGCCVRGLELTTAHRAGDPTQRSRHQAVVRAALACHSKKAKQDNATIVRAL